MLRDRFVQEAILQQDTMQRRTPRLHQSSRLACTCGRSCAGWGLVINYRGLLGLGAWGCSHQLRIKSYQRVVLRGSHDATEIGPFDHSAWIGFCSRMRQEDG